jgi:hypothetical protein
MQTMLTRCVLVDNAATISARIHPLSCVLTHTLGAMVAVDMTVALSSFICPEHLYGEQCSWTAR